MFRQRSSVDLPAPLRPMMPITSEGRTAKETSSIILLPENDLLSASIFSNGNNDCGFIRVISLGEYISAIFFQCAVFIQLFEPSIQPRL